MSFDKGNIWKYSLIFLILLTCISDVATFLWSGLWEFEINPLILALKGSIGMYPAIILAICIKTGIILALAFTLWKSKVKEDKSHLLYFMLTYLSVIIILLQIFGTYANVHTTLVYQEQGPEVVQPMPVEESTQLLTSWSTIFYIFTAINLVSFWVYEKIYREEK